MTTVCVQHWTCRRKRRACWDAQHAHHKQKNICVANTVCYWTLACHASNWRDICVCATASWWRLSYVLDNVGCVTANAAWGETRFHHMIHPSCKEAVWKGDEKQTEEVAGQQMRTCRTYRPPHLIKYNTTYCCCQFSSHINSQAQCWSPRSL